MIRFLRALFRKERSTRSGSRSQKALRGSSRQQERRYDGFSISTTAGNTSKATVLVNDTDKTLHLKDKVGPAIGGTRYTMLPNSQIEVTPLQHTFFKLVAYAIVEEEEDGEQGSELGSSDGRNSKKKGIYTRLSIDSDQLADHRQIRIYFDGSKYNLDFSHH